MCGATCLTNTRREKESRTEIGGCIEAGGEGAAGEVAEEEKVAEEYVAIRRATEKKIAAEMRVMEAKKKLSK
jgi:hypothetical protein